VRILFVSPGMMQSGPSAVRLAPFHEADIELLRELGHRVDVLPWAGRPLGRMIRAARRCDVVFAWGIGDHAFIAALLGRRLACVIGGYEFASLPQVGYGNLRSPRRRWMTKTVWKRADALLYVDPSLMEEATAAFGHPGRAHYVPTGYDPSYWSPGPEPAVDRVLTVCHAPRLDQVRLKGVDLFIRAAGVIPEVEFHVVGTLPQNLERPRNVVVHGWLDRGSLRTAYREAKVYCQLSLHEGLPNALCEAMLCGCIPVGSDANGIPRAIGDTGYIVERNVNAVVAGIREALSRAELRGQGRRRIEGLFPIGRRREGLKAALESIVPSRAVRDDASLAA